MYQDKQTGGAYAQAGGYIGGAILGGSTTAASPYNGEQAIRKPEVEAEMDRLAASLEMLGKVTESMCVRLEPIRRKTGLANGAASAPQPVQCALASALRDRRESVERCIAQLQSATSELEI